MKNSSTQIDRKTLKILEPLNRLNPILLDELAAKSIIDEVPAGRVICSIDEKDSRQIYLLSGQIEVTKIGETKSKVIKTKSALKTPIAEGSPRTVTLKAKVSSTLLYIDADLLELLLSDEPQLTASYEVNEISSEDSDDWMLTFLQSPAFLKLPTENIQKLLTHMEEVPVKKDQVIIKQGDKDDNYYIIKSGSCNVHRKPFDTAANVLLAVLPTGSGFGEEALISNGTRNATITMRENGTLMRLKKEDFLSLLIKPLIAFYEFSETDKKLEQGSLIIDVRSEQESKINPLENSVNIPLSMLRMKFDSLNPEREYLLVCDDSSQSSAAAFLMIQGGLLNCLVLKDGLNSANPAKAESKKVENRTTIDKAQEQALVAKQQTEQLAIQQQKIKDAREKAEQDVIKHKKELADARARISKKNENTDIVKQQSEQPKVKAETTKKIQHAEEVIKLSQAAAEQTRKQAENDAAQIKQRAINEAEQLREEEAKKLAEQARQQVLEKEALAKQCAIKKAEQEQAEIKMQQAEQTRLQAEKAAELIKQRALEEAQQIRETKEAEEAAKAQAESDAIKLRQEETNKALLHAEEVIKQSVAKAEQAEKEAELIKQQALEEAELLRAKTAAEELAKAQAESDAIKLRQEETNKALIEAEAVMRQSIEKAEQAEQAEQAAEQIKQKAIEEAEYLRAEVEATKNKMEQDAARLKEEEELIKQSALKVKSEAENIRREALNDAKQVRLEIEETRNLLSKKLQKTEEEEKRKHDAIIAKAKEDADKLSALKTQQAEDEAEAIRQKAREDALALHNELEETRKKIEAEAARAIDDLKEQSQLIAEQEAFEIEDEDLIEVVDEQEQDFSPDYTSISIPGMSESLFNDDEARLKAESIKSKLTQTQENKLAKEAASVKIHQSHDKTILESSDDLFVFKEPKTKAVSYIEDEMPSVSNRTHAESALTQISIEPVEKSDVSKSVVIYPQQEQETANRNNPFLNQGQSHTSTSYNIPQFDKQAYLDSQKPKSNSLAIAASFMLILAGAIFTLHVTDTLKVQSIASLFNSGNDTVQSTAIAKTKTIRKNVLRADTKVSIKKKVENNMDNIMQGWQDVLSEAKNPKKSQDKK